MIDTFGYCISPDTLLLDVKQVLVEQFKATGRLPAIADSYWLRIWEKLGSSKGRLLKYDRKSLQENGFPVCDWRHVFVQLLDNDWRPPDFEEANMLMLTQRWFRGSWSVGPPVEISVPANMSASILFDKLSLASGISASNLKVLVLFAFTEIFLCGLDDEVYLSSKNVRWLQRPTTDLSIFEWYTSITNGSTKADLADGTLLVIQDSSEELRELTVDEKLSQQNALQGESYYNADMFSTTVSSNGSYILRPVARTEKGIRIKTRSEKESITPSPEPRSDSATDSANFDIF